VTLPAGGGIPPTVGHAVPFAGVEGPGGSVPGLPAAGPGARTGRTCDRLPYSSARRTLAPCPAAVNSLPPGGSQHGCGCSPLPGRPAGDLALTEG